MPNKIILVVLLLLALPSCDDSKEKTKIEEGETSQNLSEYYEILPHSIYKNLEEYIIVFREGSIEFSNDLTALCLKKGELNSQELEVRYILNNGAGGYVELGEPETVIFKFKINNTLAGVNVLDEAKKLKRFKDYEQSFGPDFYGKRGEGHCSNRFYVSLGEDELFILNDVKGDKTLRQGISELYQQISLSEFYQLESLKHECDYEPLDYLQMRANDSVLERFKLGEGSTTELW